MILSTFYLNNFHIQMLVFLHYWINLFCFYSNFQLEIQSWIIRMSIIMWSRTISFLLALLLQTIRCYRITWAASARASNTSRPSWKLWNNNSNRSSCTRKVSVETRENDFSNKLRFCCCSLLLSAEASEWRPDVWEEVQSESLDHKSVA